MSMSRVEIQPEPHQINIELVNAYELDRINRADFSTKNTKNYQNNLFFRILFFFISERLNFFTESP